MGLAGYQRRFQVVVVKRRGGGLAYQSHFVVNFKLDNLLMIIHGFVNYPKHQNS